MESAASAAPDERHRHLVGQPAKRRDIARPRLVVDRTGHHEEPGLVAGMRHEIDQHGRNRGLASKPDQQHEQAKRRDRRLRQDLLEIGFLERPQRPQISVTPPKATSTPVQTDVPPSTGVMRPRR